MRKWIAQTVFDCVDNEGNRALVRVKIAAPEDVPREGKLGAFSRCFISMEPWVVERGIGGQDGFQAICLAIEFVRLMLKTFVAKGGRVFFSGTDTLINLDDPSFCPFPEVRQKSK